MPAVEKAGAPARAQPPLDEQHFVVLMLEGALSEGFTGLPILWYDVSVLQ